MFVARIANFFGHGNQFTHYPDGRSIMNVLAVRLPRYRIRIIQDPRISNNSLKPGRPTVTSDVEIEGVKRFSEGENIVFDLCHLLSFAAVSQVVPVEFGFKGQTTRIGIAGGSWLFRPVIEIENGSATEGYLEKTWAQYRKEKRRRKLPEVIEMLVFSDSPSLPLETRLLHTFVVLENLKATYARSKGIPFVKGFFRKLSDPPKANPKKEETFSFQELLKAMFHDVGMAPTLRRLVKLRNEIIHFGLSKKPYESLIKNHESAQDIIREYLLRLLEYEGPYLIYSKACRSGDLRSARRN